MKTFRQTYGGSLKQHFYQIIFKSDKQIMEEKDFEVWVFSHFLILQQPKFYTECKSLNNFERGPTKEHSCEVWLKLVLRFRTTCLKLKVNNGWRTTDDGQSRVIRIDPLIKEQVFKQVENNVAKGEIAHEQCHLYPQSSQTVYAAEAPESVCMWKMVNLYLI